MTRWHDAREIFLVRFVWDEQSQWPKPYLWFFQSAWRILNVPQPDESFDQPTKADGWTGGLLPLMNSYEGRSLPINSHHVSPLLPHKQKSKGHIPPKIITRNNILCCCQKSTVYISILKAQCVILGLVYDFYICKSVVLTLQYMNENVYLEYNKSFFGFPTHRTVLIYI